MIRAPRDDELGLVGTKGSLAVSTKNAAALGFTKASSAVGYRRPAEGAV